MNRQRHQQTQLYNASSTELLFLVSGVWQPKREQAIQQHMSSKF